MGIAGKAILPPQPAGPEALFPRLAEAVRELVVPSSTPRHQDGIVELVAGGTGPVVIQNSVAETLKAVGHAGMAVEQAYHLELLPITNDCPAQVHQPTALGVDGKAVLG